MPYNITLDEFAKVDHYPQLQFDGENYFYIHREWSDKAGEKEIVPREEIQKQMDRFLRELSIYGLGRDV